MLTEQRYEMILNLLEENKSVTVTQIKELLHISESTARRDITALHQAGKLIKVFGGAVALEGEVISREPTVQQKENVNKEQKIRIAKYAASLIEPDDFVFIDADKGNNPRYLELCLQLSRPGTVIIGDNVVRHGKIIDENARGSNIKGLRSFFELMSQHPQLDATAIQTVGAKSWDGFSMAIVK